MKNISLYLYTFFKGNLVGKDDDGNKYYTSNISHGVKKEKRWVLYKNDNDPTNIDPIWHGWLHHIIEDVPNPKTKKNFSKSNRYRKSIFSSWTYFEQGKKN